jgi:hypothetical protein
MVINYEAEVKNLRKNFEYFKPKQGSYKITFLGEPESDSFIEKETGEAIITIKTQVSVVDNRQELKEYNWSIFKNDSDSSLYGQLMKLGLKHGKLMGVHFTLLVNNDGKKNSYMIPEVL